MKWFKPSTPAEIETSRRVGRFMGWFALMGGALRLGFIMGAYTAQQVPDGPRVGLASTGLWYGFVVVAVGVWGLWSNRRKPAVA